MNEPVTRSESCMSVREPEEGGMSQRTAGAAQGPRHLQDQVLARPAAFMATPIALLPSSMNLAKPAPSAHFTPKPRLAMNSRNSAASLTFLRAAVIAFAISAGSPLGAANPRQAPVL